MDAVFLGAEDYFYDSRPEGPTIVKALLGALFLKVISIREHLFASVSLFVV